MMDDVDVNSKIISFPDEKMQPFLDLLTEDHVYSIQSDQDIDPLTVNVLKRDRIMSIINCTKIVAFGGTPKFNSVSDFECKSKVGTNILAGNDENPEHLLYGDPCTHWTTFFHEEEYRDMLVAVFSNEQLEMIYHHIENLHKVTIL